jgi:hypothetical protein
MLKHKRFIIWSIAIYCVSVTCCFANDGDNLLREGIKEENIANRINNKLEENMGKQKLPNSSKMIQTSEYKYAHALSLYLEASEKGNSLAAWKAASLGSSGMTPGLPEQKINTLVIQAAKGDIVDAQMNIVLINCNTDFSICKNKSDTLFWLKRSVQLKNNKAENILGYLYEQGVVVEKNINKSYACYEASSRDGNKTAKANFNRVKKHITNNKLEQCE